MYNNSLINDICCCENICLIFSYFMPSFIFFMICPSNGSLSLFFRVVQGISSVNKFIFSDIWSYIYMYHINQSIFHFYYLFFLNIFQELIFLFIPAISLIFPLKQIYFLHSKKTTALSFYISDITSILVAVNVQSINMIKCTPTKSLVGLKKLFGDKSPVHACAV